MKTTDVTQKTLSTCACSLLRASIKMKKAARYKEKEILGPRSLAVTEFSM